MSPSQRARQAEWEGEAAAMVKFAKAEGREAAYDPYLAQLEVAHTALERGDTETVYVAMNDFMTMLEHHPEAAGVPMWSAQTIFDFCGRVTPPMYHDISRHAHDKYAGHSPSALADAMAFRTA
jgi:hypothetical protein